MKKRLCMLVLFGLFFSIKSALGKKKQTFGLLSVLNERNSINSLSTFFLRLDEIYKFLAKLEKTVFFPLRKEKRTNRPFLQHKLFLKMHDSGWFDRPKKRYRHRKIRKDHPIIRSILPQFRIDGPLLPTQVYKVVRSQQGKIKGCYTKRLKTIPSLRGKVTFRWNVHVDGSVKAAVVVQTTMNDEQVESCILKVIKKLKFPNPPNTTAKVFFPFMFLPSHRTR